MVATFSTQEVRCGSFFMRVLSTGAFFGGGVVGVDVFIKKAFEGSRFRSGDIFEGALFR